MIKKAPHIHALMGNAFQIPLWTDTKFGVASPQGVRSRWVDVELKDYTDN